MRFLGGLLILFILVFSLQSCFILGQVVYDEDDCRVYYIYSEDEETGRRTLEWDSEYCGAGGGLTRMQWDSKYTKLREENPETRYTQALFEHTQGTSYTFDEYKGFVLSDNPFAW